MLRGVHRLLAVAEDLAALWSGPAGEAQRQIRLLCLAASAGDETEVQVCWCHSCLPACPIACCASHKLQTRQTATHQRSICTSCSFSCHPNCPAGPACQQSARLGAWQCARPVIWRLTAAAPGGSKRERRHHAAAHRCWREFRGHKWHWAHSPAGDVVALRPSPSTAAHASFAVVLLCNSCLLGNSHCTHSR